MKKVILFIIIFLVLLLKIYFIIQLNTQYKKNYNIENKIVSKKSSLTIQDAIDKIVLPQHRDIIKAMIFIESKGDTLAVSNTGDYGILQVNKYWWGDKYDFNRMHELEYGLQCGYDIFKIYYEISNGNIRETLKRYNGSYEYADKVINMVENSINQLKNINYNILKFFIII